MALFEAEHITFTYPDELVPALKDVSFRVQEGDFIVLCGPSGSGKSTFLRMMKQEVRPNGVLEGDMFYDGVPFVELSSSTMARDIGMVFQDPENQIVMDRVMEELIFGLENIGLESDQMRKKVAEMVHFFGLESLLDRPTHELSGGQKQIVNLASILLMEPRILLLDEPTSQLDPIAAKDFIHMLRRMNEELGIAVVIAEHRLEDVWGLAERVIVLENGTLVHDGSARDVAHQLSLSDKDAFFNYLPAASRLFIRFPSTGDIEKLPISVKEGKHWAKTLKASYGEGTVKKEEENNQSILLDAKNIDFQYERSKPRILDRLSLTLKSQEKLAIVGGNGTGKSTLLKVLSGLLKPQHGNIYCENKKVTGKRVEQMAYLPQNPRLYFSEKSVGQEIAKALNLNATEAEKIEILDWLNFKGLEKRHPYDLSGGEMQKVALACLLLRQPKILLIDEPTKGLDPVSKRRFGEWLNHFNKKGISIIFVTHDIDFAASFSDRVAMMFRGEITSTVRTDEFFKGNAFYTTAVNRITRNANVPEVLTVEEACRTWVVEK
jgi:energy-coupling factor transport system ATP-binding protein